MSAVLRNVHRQITTASTSMISATASTACKFCLSAHVDAPSSYQYQGLMITKTSVRWKGNWKQRHAKREGREDVIVSHSGGGKESAKTRIVYAWGAASSGALGIPSYLKPNLKFKGRQFHISQINRPARVRFYDERKIKPLHAACGNGFTVVYAQVENRNAVMVTGMNTDCQLGFQHTNNDKRLDQLIEPNRLLLPLAQSDMFDVDSIACGRAHTLLAVRNQGVLSLGSNASGQCGRPIVEDEDYSSNPRINQVKDLPDDIVKVTCGQDHSLFLSSSGEVYSCGMGADGQTGSGHYKNIGNPVQLAGDLEGERIVSIAGKGDCSLAVSERGEVFGWGNSEYGQLSSVSESSQVSVPTRLPTGHCGRVVKAVAGGSMCALVNDQGQVYVWGFGILGKGPDLESCSAPSLIPEPIFGRNELSPDRKVVDVDCGLSYMAAMTDTGDVFTWGRNLFGCLGLGEDRNQFFPWRVSLPAQAVSMSCGLDHMIAVCKPFS